MSSLVEAFKDVAGGQLRVVATLESIDYEVEYVREDLEDEYTRMDFDRAYQSMMANQVSAEDFKSVGEFGDLDCQLFLFTELIVFLFPSSRYSGVFVSFDREPQFPLLDIVDAATDVSHLGEDDS
ncbi:hypothetical protein [Halorarum halobium]|uniref:hypothetical protein n=1 Tax=Halorarum halobium TaxID=3075121 RepID=UPI0028B23FB8|nr:hypothetical protein [Halobaculum sp. XH14]